MPSPFANTNNSFYFFIGGVYYKITPPNLIRSLSGEPVGWDAFKWVFRRNKYHGVDIRHSRGDITLKFTLSSGLNYIKDVYEGTGNTTLPVSEKEKGFEGKITLVLANSIASTPQPSDIVFEADLMLEDLQKGVLGNIRGVQCPVVFRYYDDRLLNKIDEKTNVMATESIFGDAITSISPVSIEMHEVALINFNQWESNPVDFSRPFNFQNIMSTAGSRAYFLPAFEIKDTNEIDVSFDYNNLFGSEGGGTVLSDKLYLHKFEQPGYFKKFDLIFRATLYRTFAINGYDSENIDIEGKYVVVRRGEIIKEIVFGSDTWVVPTFTGILPIAFDVDYSYTPDKFLFAQEDEVYIFLDCVTDTDHTGGVVSYDAFFDAVSSYRLLGSDFISSLEQEFIPLVGRTVHDSFFIHELLNKLAANVTGQDGLIYSDYYGKTDSQFETYLSNGCGSERVFYSGELLRGYSLDDRDMFVSFKEALECLSLVDNIGMAIESIDGNDRLRLEPIQHFYKDVELLNLTSPTDYTEKVNKNLLFSSIEFEQKDWKIEDKGGLDEIITKQRHSMPLSKANKKYVKASEVVLGTYPNEWTRRKRARANGAEDTPYDEKIFMTQVSYVRQTSVTDDLDYSVGGTLGSFIIFVPGHIENIDWTKGVTISGSTNNNGNYTCIGVSLTTVSSVDTTAIFVIEELVFSSVENATVTYFEYVPYGTADSIIVPEKEEKVTNIENTAQSTGNPSVSNSTFLNLRLNLKESLLKHLVWLGSVLGYNESTDSIKFTSGEGNYKANIEIDNSISCYQNTYDQTISPSQEERLEVGKLLNVLFSEKLITFRHKLTFTQIQDLENAFRSGNNGYISTIDEEGNPVRGFPAYDDSFIEWNPVTLMAEIKLMKI